MEEEQQEDGEPLRLYCVCQSDGTDGREYVGCDGCDGWYHPECIGLTHAEVRDPKEPSQPR